MSGRRLGVLLAAVTMALAAASTAGAATPPGDAARSLLPLVPTSHRYSCAALDPSSDLSLDTVRAEAASIDAAVVCGPDGPADAIYYYAFRDAAAMGRTYQAVVTGTNPSADPDCEGDSGWAYGDDTHGGRIFCYLGVQTDSGPIPATAVLVWTSDTHNILGLAQARRGDADARGLRKWWNASAGPTRRSDDAGLASPSDRPDAGDENVILRAIPKQTRRSCERGDRTSPESISGSLYDHRYFIDAVITCRSPDPAVDYLWYAKLDPGVVEDFTAQVYGLSDDQLAQGDDTGSGRCTKQSTYSVGKGRAKRVLGTYACYYLQDQGDGTRPVVWRWTDARQGILAVAMNTSGDVDALRSWWSGSRSGPIQP